jgi:hypothetical protein
VRWVKGVGVECEGVWGGHGARRRGEGRVVGWERDMRGGMACAGWGEGGGWALAETLRLNTTLTSLNLANECVGRNGGREWWGGGRRERRE